jgi:histidinol-phosphate aminotransferase
MAEAVTENTKLLWIANPNNPTGTIVRKEALDRLFAVLPSHVTVVLDEAYFEFAADEPGYVTSLDYLKAGASVIGLRTMSKAYGLAGIRLGFGFASPATVDAVDRAREPFNCNSLAQVAAIAALEDEDHLRRSVESNAAGRRQLEAVLREVGGKPVETFANFVFADMGQPAQPIFEALLREGVIVRSGHVLGMPTYLRVSIGTHDENEKFAHALRAVMNRVAV